MLQKPTLIASMTTDMLWFGQKTINNSFWVKQRSKKQFSVKNLFEMFCDPKAVCWLLFD